MLWFQPNLEEQRAGINFNNEQSQTVIVTEQNKEYWLERIKKNWTFSG